MSKQDHPLPKRERTPNNRTTTGFRISDELWAALEPLLPEHANRHRFGGGRPRMPDRTCANVIFYVLRTGCQWQALDQTELCAHSTAHDRFQTWVEAGVFLQLWHAGVQQFDEVCGIERDWLAMDGAITEAPLGGGESGAQSHRGRSGVNRSLLVESHGTPISLVAEGANRHDMKLGARRRRRSSSNGPSQPPEQPQEMCLDAGYNY